MGWLANVWVWYGLAIYGGLGLLIACALFVADGSEKEPFWLAVLCWLLIVIYGVIVGLPKRYRYWKKEHYESLASHYVAKAEKAKMNSRRLGT